jgi:transcription elongation factor GreA
MPAVDPIADSITPEGYEALRVQLEFLRGDAREGVARRLREAREDGYGMGGNPGVTHALQEQELLERRIAKVEAMLSSARVTERTADGTVQVGSTVRIRPRGGRVAEYHIVGALESDAGRGKLSVACPAGRALLGASPGDVVTFDAPVGVRRFEVLTVDDAGAALAA